LNGIFIAKPNHHALQARIFGKYFCLISSRMVELSSRNHLLGQLQQTFVVTNTGSSATYATSLRMLLESATQLIMIGKYLINDIGLAAIDFWPCPLATLTLLKV